MTQKKPNSLASAVAIPVPPRRLRRPTYKSFKLQRRLKHHVPTVPGSWRLLRGSLGLLIDRWQLFTGIVLIFGVMQLVFVQGFGNTGDIATVKSTVASALGTADTGAFSTGLASFGYLLGKASAGSAYQALSVLITSLALIWAIRQVYAAERPRIRDGFYQGMAPLVPFVLVLLTIAVQVLPAVIITYLFSYASTSGVVSHGVEYLLWIVLISSSYLLTFYMICSSVFALYIVTLPGMTPLKALRGARELVRFRRWMVMRRIAFLPIALGGLAGLVIVPLIMFVPTVAGYIFILVSLFGIAVIHSYMYRLYKELLG